MKPDIRVHESDILGQRLDWSFRVTSFLRQIHFGAA